MRQKETFPQNGGDSNKITNGAIIVSIAVATGFSTVAQTLDTLFNPDVSAITIALPMLVMAFVIVIEAHYARDSDE